MTDKLSAIEQSGEPASINGFTVHPFAATCVLLVLAVLSDARREVLLRSPLATMVRTCVAELADDDVAERFVRMGLPLAA